MDEPLSKLTSGRAKLRVLHTELRLLKFTTTSVQHTIYVTHDQTEAMTLADRIVIMSATKNEAGTGTIGHDQQIGSPEELTTIQLTSLLLA